MGHHHKEDHTTGQTTQHDTTGTTFAAENMPKQYETRTETIEKVPQMRKEQQTEYVPRMHERQEEVEVPVHKVVMEKQTRTVNEMRHEPVQREVAVPTGDYKERVVDHNRHPGYVDTGVDRHHGEGHHQGMHTAGTHHTGTTTGAGSGVGSGVGTGVGSGVGSGVNYGSTGTTGVGPDVNYGKDSGLEGHHHGTEHKSTMQKIKGVGVPGSKKEY